MNYSFKKTHLRLLSLLLVLLSMVSLFAGCKKSEPETAPTTEEAVPPGLVEIKPTEEITEPTTEATEPVDENAAVINTDNTDVRQTPSMDANPIGKLNKGTQVTIIREVSVGGVGWTLIREGWVKSDALDKAVVSDKPEDTTIQTPAQMENAQNGGTTTSSNASNSGNSVLYKGTITANPELNIRKEADQYSARVGTYKKGEVVEILETKNGWGRTNKGWISLTFVSQGTNANTQTNSATQNHNNTNNNTTNSTGTATNVKGIILTELNIRKEASQNSDRVGGYSYGDRVTILETSGNWGRTDKGWVSLTYVYQDGTQGSNGCKGVVIGNGLNVRSGPGTNYQSVNSLGFGTRVNILQRITLGDVTWGCINGGWISLDHVYIDGTEGVGAGEGTCNGNNVNIRSGPGTTYAAVGTANLNDYIKIYAQIEMGNITWGYVERGNVKGWMSMQYANMG